VEDHTVGGRVLRFFVGFLVTHAGPRLRGTVELMAGLYMRRL
jgi:hypothetical protein